MTRQWCAKKVQDLTNKEKDHIIETIFDIILNNEMFEDMGEEIDHFLVVNEFIYIYKLRGEIFE